MLMFKRTNIRRERNEKNFNVFLSCGNLCASSYRLPNKTYEIALITDKGDIDDKSFNQGSWEGVKLLPKKEVSPTSTIVRLKSR